MNGIEGLAVAGLLALLGGCWLRATRVRQPGSGPLKRMTLWLSLVIAAVPFSYQLVGGAVQTAPSVSLFVTATTPSAGGYDLGMRPPSSRDSGASDPLAERDMEGLRVAPASVLAATVVAAETEVTQIEVSASRYPQSAKHIQDAQAAGQSTTLTIDRAGAAARRAESMRGNPRIRGLDRDEYPPAMFEEGGTGSSVRGIGPSDNRGAGSSIGNQCRGLPNGSVVTIVIGC